MAEISRRYIAKYWVVPVRKPFYFHHCVQGIKLLSPFSFNSEKQTRSQGLWGQNTFLGGQVFVFPMFETNFSGHNRIWGHCPRGYRSVEKCLFTYLPPTQDPNHVLSLKCKRALGNHQDQSLGSN